MRMAPKNCKQVSDFRVCKPVIIRGLCCGEQNALSKLLHFTSKCLPKALVNAPLAGALRSHSNAAAAEASLKV
jgi:hypothetical protein